MKLFELGFPPETVLAHPRHHRAQPLLTQLIWQVRGCASHQDGLEAQRVLLGHLLEVEELRAATSQAVKRMSRGMSAQAGAPEPESGGDPALLATWQLENAVAERVARQLRSIGDALAWQAGQHHHERPDSVPFAGARVGPLPQESVVDLRLGAGVDLIAQRWQPEPTQKEADASTR